MMVTYFKRRPILCRWARSRSAFSAKSQGKLLAVDLVHICCTMTEIDRVSCALHLNVKKENAAEVGED